MSEEEAKTRKPLLIDCTILYVEFTGPKHHTFTCRNIKTGKKFEVITKYQYFYNDFSKSNSGLNLRYWKTAGFRQVINRLIEFETKLAWTDPDEGDNGPQLQNKQGSEDQFTQWLNEHHKFHQENCYGCDFTWDCSKWENEVFPNRNTDSPVESI